MAPKRAKAKAKASALGPSQPEAVEGPAGMGVAAVPDPPDLPPNAYIEGPAVVRAAAAPDLPELPPIADVEGPVGLSAAAAPHQLSWPNSQRGPRSGVASQSAHLQATINFAFPAQGSPTCAVKSCNKIAPDVEFRFEFQALNALQHGTEDYCVHMFVNGSIAVAHRNVATVGVADTNLRLHLADTNGRALVGESSSSSRLRSRSPA